MRAIRTREPPTSSRPGPGSSTSWNATRWSARTCWTGPTKLRLLEGFRQRENLSWSAPRLHLIDLQYSDVRLDKGLYNRLVARGSMKRLITEQQVLDAVDNPPTDTRAYFRGECLRRFGADIAAASWDSVIFDLGGESLVRIPTLEPLRVSKATSGRCWTRWTARLNWSNNSLRRRS